MKIDNERPYHSTVFHELVSNGGPKVDGEPEIETKHNCLADKMVEQSNPSERSFMKAEHQNGGKTGQIRADDVLYDKDIVEIKLPDTVLSVQYGGQFVKDVCIDEGVLVDQKASAEQVVGDKVAPNGGSMEEARADPVKSAHELKSQIIILPVSCATEDNLVEQYSSCNEHDLEDINNGAGFTNLNDEKLSPKQSLSHGGAEDFQQLCTVISETSENHEPFLDGEMINQVSSSDCQGFGVSIASEISSHDGLPLESTSNGISGMMPEEEFAGAALDTRRSNQVNHYNPFIAYGSLEDTWEPKYSLPIVAEAACILPICPVEKIDSFSDLVNGPLGGLDSVETDDSRTENSRLCCSVEGRSNTLGIEASDSNNQGGTPVEKTDSFSDIIYGAPGGSDPVETEGTRTDDSRLDSIEASSSRLDLQASGECNDQTDNLTNEIKIDPAHGTSIVASVSTSSEEPSGVKSDNQSKSEIDSTQDLQDFNPRDVDDGTKRSEDNTDNKGPMLVQTEPVVQQNGPDSAKLMARTGMRNPFELSFSGPSLSSDPLTPSGHIPYSGNISLRSDSSTTSTRSFAFPVLQTEWNSSPVKMAKADRRRLRQDRGWGYRILCCKF